MPSVLEFSRMIRSSLHTERRGRAERPAARARRLRTWVSLPVLLACAAVRAALAEVPEGWSPELGQAFELYDQGRFVEAQQACEQIQATARDALVAADAEALAAMSLLRSASRAERLSGRGLLAEVARRHADYWERPECRLAYGVGQLGLNETASALEYLHAAREMFRSQGRAERWLDASALLVEAWTRHSEWEVPLPSLGLGRASGPLEAEAVRLAQIQAIRQEVARAPDADAALAAIDRLLALYWLGAGRDPEQGLALLEQVAARPQRIRAVAQACLDLAREYERRGRADDALRWLNAVATAGPALPDLADQAAARTRALRAPSVELDLPDHARPGADWTFGATTRNIAALRIEVRRVDLAAVLTQSRGRLIENHLPESGAALATFDLHPGNRLTWSTSDHDRPSLNLPAGTFVVSATATTSAGEPYRTKRLLAVSSIEALVLLEPRGGWLWITDAAGRSLSGDVLARFWVAGAFVPRRLEVENGWAAFDLPGEARVLRADQWVCLIEAGEQTALCGGALPGGAAEPVAVVVTPAAAARPGSWLPVAGYLVDPDAAARGPQPLDLMLELRDAVGKLQARGAAEVDDTGLFQGRIAIPLAAADRKLRLSVKVDGRSPTTIPPNQYVVVGPLDADPLALHLSGPQVLAPDTPLIEVRASAGYPWGMPLSGQRLNYWARPTALPTPDRPGPPLTVSPLSDHLRLDVRGSQRIQFATETLRMKERPLAVLLHGSVPGLGLSTPAQTLEMLLSPSAAQVWIHVDPPQPAAGDLVRFAAAWFDPQRRALDRPTLTLAGPGDGEARVLDWFPTIEGNWSAPVRLGAAGTYEVRARLPLIDGEAIEVARQVQVQEPAEGGPPPGLAASLRGCEAVWVRDVEGVKLHVTLAAPPPVDVLAVTSAGARPIGAVIRSGTGERACSIRLPGGTSSGARVALFARGDRGIERVATTVGVAEAADASALALVAPPEPPAAGSIARIQLQSAELPEGTPVLARLSRLDHSGPLAWVHGDLRDPFIVPRRGPIVSNSLDAARGSRAAGVAPTGAAAGLETEPDLEGADGPLSAASAVALFDGATEWVDLVRCSDRTALLEAPIPEAPGRFRLFAWTVASGRTAIAVQDIDTRRAWPASLDGPRVLELGDRTVAVLSLENPRSASATLEIEWAGGGVVVGRVDPLGAVQLESPRTESVRASFGGNDRGRLLLHVEAVALGAGVLTMVIRDGAATQRCSWDYEVVGARSATQPARAGLRLQRSLFRLVPQEDAPDSADRPIVPRAAPLAEDALAYALVPLAPDERVPAGQRILVREDVACDEPLRQVQWTQRLSANAATTADAAALARPLGFCQRRQFQQLEYACNSIAQRARHEYVIVALRPGACRLALPQVRAEGLDLAITCEPAETRIVVEN